MEKIPDSISALVYGMKHSIFWTLGVWTFAALGLVFMLPYDENYASVAFLSCDCIVIVGAMPLIKKEANTLHNIFGIVGCLLSQLWTAIAGDISFLYQWWVLYPLLLIALFLFGYERKWCFFAEIWCAVSIIYTLLH